MIKTLDINKIDFLRIALVLAPLAIYWGFNYDNIQPLLFWGLAILILPYIISFSETEGSYRFGVISLLAGLLLLFFRSNSLFYFSAVFLMLYILEIGRGRLNYLPVFLIIAISPVISIIMYIWSFPIRLKLSEWAVATLRLLNLNITASGNVLTWNGHTFAVDPACIGLKMVITSLVLGILILGHFEKKYHRTLSFVHAGLLLCFVLLASILSNFMRLLTLIIFHILPENILHEVIGIFSLILYVLLPFYFLADYTFSKKWGTVKVINSKVHFAKAMERQVQKWSIVFLLLLLLWNAVPFLEEKIESFGTDVEIQLAGFEKSVTKRGMLKFQNEDALIYVKAPVQFFQGSHDPRYCWQGSGYVFSEIALEIINGRQCYTAILRKENDLLFTAWWYQKGEFTTPYEDWRWDSFRGRKGYALVNVNCSNRKDLEHWIGVGIAGL